MMAMRALEAAAGGWFDPDGALGLEVGMAVVVMVAIKGQPRGC